LIDWKLHFERLEQILFECIASNSEPSAVAGGWKLYNRTNYLYPSATADGSDP